MKKNLELKTAIATQKGKFLDQMIEKEISRRKGKIAFRGLGKNDRYFLINIQKQPRDKSDQAIPAENDVSLLDWRWFKMPEAAIWS